MGFWGRESVGLVPRRKDVRRKREGEKRLEEGSVRKTTHAGQTVWKTVAEEERVKCVTTRGLCIDPQWVKDGHYSKLQLQSGTTSPRRHLQRRHDHDAGGWTIAGCRYWRWTLNRMPTGDSVSPLVTVNNWMSPSDSNSLVFFCSSLRNSRTHDASVWVNECVQAWPGRLIY